jgi:glycosyltransferase involved in cell wall biosynthesis
LAKVTRLAILSSHPIQYYGPLFCALAQRVELTVLFAHSATPQDQARAGFGTPFDWDVDITSGYAHEFLENVARRRGTDHFGGCDTPQVGELLRAGRFDALLLTGWHLKSYLQALFAAKRQGLPVIVRGDSQLATPRSRLKQAAKALAYPPLLRMFDAALYVGERSRAYFAHYRYPDRRLFFSPHCVDTTWFARRATESARRSLRSELGVADQVALVLFAGKLVEFKRPGDLLRAAAALRERGRAIEVLFAGDGELRSQLTALAAELRAPAYFLGFSNQSRMPAVYAAADLLALPSSAHETWGLVVNEALACGLPIVISDACGCAVDLAPADETKRTGCVFPVGDLAAFSQAIESTLDRPPWPAHLADMTARYSIDAAAEGICSALHFVERRT